MPDLTDKEIMITSGTIRLAAPPAGTAVYIQKPSRLRRFLRRVPLLRRFVHEEFVPAGNSPPEFLGRVVGIDQNGHCIIMIGGIDANLDR